MRGYIHIKTGERLSLHELKKRLNTSIPYLYPSVGEWELEPESEPVEIISENTISTEERLDDIENALIELAGIVAGE